MIVLDSEPVDNDCFGPGTRHRAQGPWDRAPGLERVQASGPKDQGAAINSAKHRKDFFAPGIDAIHPQLSLRTQTHTLWQCGRVAQRCNIGVHSK